MAPPPLHPDVEPLGHLVGTWEGEGSGRYPTIDPFAYVETIELWHNGKPFLGYQQRTRHPESGAPMHAESGYWRAVPAASDAPAGSIGIEGVIAHPTGLAEILTGTATRDRIVVATTSVARTPRAKEVTAVERRIEVDGDVLTYEIHMAAVGQPLQFHLAATLRHAG